MATSQPSDQELQFKKRARRRLVGAIALVLLMVTVLPMILDDHGNKAPQQEIAITIPNQEGSDFTSKIVPVDPSEADHQISTALPEQMSQPSPSSPKTEEAVPAKPAPAQVAKAEPAKTEPAKEEPEKPAAAKPQAAPVEPAKRAATGADGFYVQIGVYSNADSVKKLQDKLAAQGYKSHTETVTTSKGDKIRLRAGPFDSRLDAEGALARIKAAGLSGMVVKNG